MCPCVRVSCSISKAVARELLPSGEGPTTVVAWAHSGSLAFAGADSRFNLFDAPRWKRRKHDVHATLLFERVTSVAFSRRSGRDAYVDDIAAAFPGVGLVELLALEAARERDAVALRCKFSGDVVRSWIGLDGKPLSAFLTASRQV